MLVLFSPLSKADKWMLGFLHSKKWMSLWQWYFSNRQWDILSVQFSHSVVSNSLWHHGLQHAKLPCPSSTPRAYSNSCHWVSDAIQPSHPLLSRSLSTFNLSQHQCLFKWDRSFHQMAKILEFRLQHQSFQWTLRNDFL